MALLAAVSVAGAWNASTIAIAAVHGYQKALAPLAARAGIACRFMPTCSRYAEIVIRRDGVIKGGWETVRRIARCGPWTPAGTIDPP